MKIYYKYCLLLLSCLTCLGACSDLPDPKSTSESGSSLQESEKQAEKEGNDMNFRDQLSQDNLAEIDIIIAESKLPVTFLEEADLTEQERANYNAEHPYLGDKQYDGLKTLYFSLLPDNTALYLSQIRIESAEYSVLGIQVGSAYSDAVKNIEKRGYTLTADYPSLAAGEKGFYSEYTKGDIHIFLESDAQGDKLTAYTLSLSLKKNDNRWQ